MNIRRVTAAAMLLSLAWASSASAAPSLVGIGAFAGDTAITFDALANNTAVTNQFSGVTVSGGLFADTGAGGGPGAPGMNGSTTADNYSNPYAGVDNNPITFDFSPLYGRVGFDFYSNGGTVTVTVYGLGGSVTGVFPLAGGPQFIGIADPSGISRIDISVSGGAPNNAWVMDNLLLGDPIVPEPASIATWSVLGLAGGWWRRRQKGAASKA